MMYHSQNNVVSNNINEVKSYENEFGYTLNVKEVADILNLHPNAVYKLLHQGKIPYKRLDRNYIIPRDPFFNWLHDLSNKKKDHMY